MGNILQEAVRNRLLLTLSAADFALLSPHLRPIDLPISAVLEEPGDEIISIIFL